MPLDARAPGLQHIGDYDVLDKIAEGGMGAVYKARHKTTGQVVAIKVLPPTTVKNPVLLKRFEQEYRAATAIDHPHVVRALEFCGTGPAPFLVMEYVDGESLGAKVDRDGPLPEEAAVRIIAQVCQGLHRAHKQKLVHRDVKPDNILVTADGTAKLTDLGLVKIEDDELNLTKTGRGLGTPNYMAPEQFRDAKNADVRCDIYSLGATLYTLLTGETPFGKVGPLECWLRKQRNELPSPRDLNPAISERVSWAIMRSMSGDPSSRPINCKEFVEDLTGATLRPTTASAEQPAAPADLWYLVYRDELGETHTVKGTTDGIRKALKEGLLGDASNVRASRSKAGQFLTLTGHPEFRDLVVRATPAPGPAVGNPSGMMRASGVTRPSGTVRPSGQMMRQTTSAPRSKTPTPPMDAPDPEAVEYTPAPPPVGAPGHSPYDPTQDYRAAGESTVRPHLSFGSAEHRAHRPRIDWMLWAGVLAVALATTAAAVYLLPRMMRF
jgi:eukaryotic-like serine/threonine-protein kinase